MIRSWNGLGFLLALLTLQEGTVPPSPRLQGSPKPGQQARSGCPVPRGPALAPGRLTECGLASGDEHTFRISLKAGDFLQARIDQHGIDVIVAVASPAGKTLFLMDSPNGRHREEPVLFVPESSGQYLLKLSGRGQGWQGTYRLSIQELRPAGADERLRANSLRMLAEGDRLKREQPQQALQKYQAALSTWTSIRDVRGEILALERLGLLLKDYLGDPAEALAVFTRAVTSSRLLEDGHAEARFANLAGLMHRELGDLSAAKSRHEQALHLFEQAGDWEGQAQVHNNLALVLEDRGEIPSALSSYRASLAHWAKVEEPGQQARTLSNLGGLFLQVQQPEEALAAFHQALRLLEREDRRDAHYEVLDGAGLAYHILGNLEKAVWSFRLALGRAATGKERARTLHRLGTAYREQRDLAQASAVLKQSFQFAQRHGDHRRAAFALAELAHIEHLKGRHEEAIRGFDEARKALEDLPDPAPLASVLFGRAEAERGLGRLENAIASVERSIGLVESIRADLTDPELRVSFFSFRQRYNELYVEMLMEQYRRSGNAMFRARAFEASDRSRARSLLDDMGGLRPTAQAITLSEVQRESLDRDSLLLSYSLGERRSYLWIVRQDSIAILDLPSRTEVERAARQAWRKLSEGGGREEVEALSRMLLPAGVGALPPKLLVSPDGALHLIPFAVLRGADGRLLLQKQISYLPSASVLVGMRRKLASRRPAPLLLAALADPVFQRDDPRLAHLDPVPKDAGAELFGQVELDRLALSQQEAREILKWVPEDKRFQATGFGANRKTALDPALGRYQLLHFGTHHIVGNHPEMSGLVLSRFDERGEPREGFLRATEIYNLHLPVELVVLSACGTGLGRDVRGEGPLGLARAFFHAGAKRVVVSLWDVEERATTEFMTRFYRGMLRDRLFPAAALQAAQASMASHPRWRSPRFWAAFVLQGEPR